jgi:hypothetical protein
MSEPIKSKHTLTTGKFPTKQMKVIAQNKLCTICDRQNARLSWCSSVGLLLKVYHVCDFESVVHFKAQKYANKIWNTTNVHWIVELRKKLATKVNFPVEWNGLDMRTKQAFKVNYVMLFSANSPLMYVQTPTPRADVAIRLTMKVKPSLLCLLRM